MKAFEHTLALIWRLGVLLLLANIGVQLALLNSEALLRRSDCASRWVGEVVALQSAPSGPICTRIDYAGRRRAAPMK